MDNVGVSVGSGDGEGVWVIEGAGSNVDDGEGEGDSTSNNTAVFSCDGVTCDEDSESWTCFGGIWLHAAADITIKKIEIN